MAGNYLVLRREERTEIRRLLYSRSEWMVQGTTPLCGAGDPWQPNWKPEVAERSNCYGEKRLQNDSCLSCCPGHSWLAGICARSDCRTNRFQTHASVGCQGPALSHPLMNNTQNNAIPAGNGTR